MPCLALHSSFRSSVLCVCSTSTATTALSPREISTSYTKSVPSMTTRFSNSTFQLLFVTSPRLSAQPPHDSRQKS